MSYHCSGSSLKAEQIGGQTVEGDAEQNIVKQSLPEHHKVV